jgi:hypothetical protein
MAFHRFGVDGIDGESLIEQGADERTVRRLERDQDAVSRLGARTDGSHEPLQSLRGVFNRSRRQRGAGLVHQTIHVLFVRPINSDSQHRSAPPDK